MTTYRIDKDGFRSWREGDEERVKKIEIAALEVGQVYACIGNAVTLTILRIDPNEQFFEICFQKNTDDCDEELKNIIYNYCLEEGEGYNSIICGDLIETIGTENLIQRGGIL